MRIDLAIGLAGIGATFFVAGLAVLPTELKDVSYLGLTVKAEAFRSGAIVVALAGLMMLGFGLLVVINEIVKKISNLLDGMIGSLVWRHFSPKLRLVSLNDSVLDRIHQIGDRLLGADFVSLSQLKDHYAIQPAGYACWETIKDGTIRAFYVSIPLNEAGTAFILSGKANGVSSIKDVHISKKMRNPSSLYLTELYGEGFPWRGILIDRLRMAIKKSINANPKISCLLTKPVSADGLRLVRSAGFSQINGSAIWKRNLSKTDPELRSR